MSSPRLKFNSFAYRAVFLLIMGSLSRAAIADARRIYSFQDIWGKIQERSRDIQAAGHELEAASIGESRASRHWYPRLYTEFRVFGTDDPAMNFMSILGQRQIQAPDFAPDALNHPGSRLFEQGKLGLELSLYEGGARVAQADAAHMNREAKAWELKSARLGQYTETAGEYASLLILNDERQQLSQLKASVDETISTYRIGSKANPVGYSGLLGMRNLKNRLEGLLTQIQSRQNKLKNQIEVVAQDLPNGWDVRGESPKSFIERVMPQEAAKSGQAPSVRAAQSGAGALEKNKVAESAKLLPRVGLFAEGNLYGGNRSASTSYASGAFVQWDLFSAPNYGAARQAEETAAAARARAESMSQRSQAEYQSSQDSIRALATNLNLMDESAKLLEEQTTTARSLFRNGSINALQLVEVLSRRVDLLENRAETELALVQAHSTLLLNSSTDQLPQEAASE
jgi:outer membrane protein TolC